MAYAFQCKTCGRLVSSADAGERDFPTACPSCGHGVHYDPLTGLKTHEDGENWTVLADQPAETLAALAEDHGVEVSELIESHTPAEPDPAPDHEPTEISVSAEESFTSEDKPA